jgi:hypothetical protein
MSFASVVGTLKHVPSSPTRNLNVGARNTLEIFRRGHHVHVRTYVAKSSISADMNALRGKDKDEADICSAQKI